MVILSSLKINMNNPEDVKKSLNSQTLRVAVIGIGRIGLPTALSFAKSGLPTVGVDINEKLIEKINSKIFPLPDEPGYEEIFYNVIESGNFSATTNIDEVVPNSDFEYDFFPKVGFLVIFFPFFIDFYRRSQQHAERT